MLAYHQSWADDPAEEMMKPNVYWNMWTTRQSPYNKLENDLEILMVSGGGPISGVIMHVGRVTYLVKSMYLTPEEAWNAFSKGIPKSLRYGTTKSSFLKANRNRNAPNAGWIVAWVDRPINPVNEARPLGFKFRPNGWGEIEKSYISGSEPKRNSTTRKEDDHESEIWNRSDISAREKKSLVMSRRGQGLFRRRVAKIEPSCRVTGTTSGSHRRASHIKPWKMSNDQEKLDGNNGFLLAPHIDHLFDRGFISFEDNGDLLVSTKLSKKILQEWGIPYPLNVGTFNKYQRIYLKYHREACFQQIDKKAK